MIVGQLVGYPILDLKQFGLSTKCYVDAIQRMLISSLDTFGVHAQLTENTGVWVNNEKIAAVGIQIQRGISSHGFALNCNTDLKWFSHIQPCGLTLGVTSISKALHRNVSIDEAIPIIQEQFSGVFNAKFIPISRELDDSITHFINSDQ